MKSRLIYTVLAASLAFNLFFTIGYLNAKRGLKNTKTIQQRIEMIAKRLSLNEKQQKELMQIVEFSRKKSDRLKMDRKRVTLLFKSEFKKDSPDIESLRTALHDLEKDQKEFRSQASSMWRKFYDSLNEKQKRKAKVILSKHPEIAKKLHIPLKRSQNEIR